MATLKMNVTATENFESLKKSSVGIHTPIEGY
jgi:hypothetical protein